MPNRGHLPFVTLALVTSLTPALAAAPPADELMRFLDRDADGALTPHEGAEAMLHLASVADANGDGRMTIEELTNFLNADAEERNAESDAIFADLDRNEDGQLTAAEVPGEFKAIVAMADADDDGTVSRAEYDAIDFEHPGILLEIEAWMFIGDVDQNGNDAADRAELPGDFWAEISDADANDDGRITVPEFVEYVSEDLDGATFAIAGDVAFMNGVIGPTTPGRVLRLILEHPTVRTIVMEDVPGSMDDESNLRAARMIRKHGFTTHLPADGMVASGGTDFFLAGAARTAEPGAQFGVHSWGGVGEAGVDVPRDDPVHEQYLDFYREMEIPVAFYWYTLEAAGVEDVHWMTPDEIEQYRVLTSAAATAPALRR